MKALIVYGAIVVVSIVVMLVAVWTAPELDWHD
jgi:hypothetical protein